MDIINKAKFYLRSCAPTVDQNTGVITQSDVPNSARNIIQELVDEIDKLRGKYSTLSMAYDKAVDPTSEPDLPWLR